MKNLKRYKAFCGAVLLGCTAALSAPVYANNEAMMDLLRILKDKGSLTQEEFELLVNASRADAEKVEGIKHEVKQEVAKATRDVPRVKIDTRGKFKISSADGMHSFQPIGRVFWDNFWTDRDNSDATADTGTELRRARLGMQLQLFKYWKAKLEYDFAGGDAALKDGWISYNNKLNDNKYFIKVGQHHVPMGFHTISSSKYMSFVRRPLFADGPLQPARQAGIAAAISDNDERWAIHGGVFYDEPDDGFAGADGEDRITASIRVIGTPWMRDKHHLLHLGGSYMYQDQNSDNFRVRQRAITHKDTHRIFDTGTIGNGGVDSVDAFDLEALAIYGPVYALGEYINWSVDGGTPFDTGVPRSDFDIDAWTLEAGWFITGESKHYEGLKGFGSIKPKSTFPGGTGAWEVAVRYENMDLNDTNAGITGGEGAVITAGINWYPIKNIRFMLDYNKVTNFSRTGNKYDDIEPAAVTLRSMVYW